MRCVLVKRSTRETRRMKFRLVGIALILGMAVGMYVGIHSAIQSLYATRDYYYQAQHVADAEIRIIPEDLANLPSFSHVPGVKSWMARLVAPGQIRLSDTERYPTVVVAQPVTSSDINSIKILSGKALDAKTPNDVLIDRNFASYHHLAVGDHFKLTMGNAEYQLSVRGIALSPEYLIAPANPSFFVPVKGSMGVIYAPIQMIGNRLGFTLVDSLVFKAEPGTVLDQTWLNTLKRQAQTTTSVQEVLSRDQHLGHMFMNVDLGAFSIFVPAVIVIFLLAALVVGFFLVYRWIEAQRQTLGVLLALGFCRWRILLSEFIPILFITVIAVLVAAPVTAAVLHDFAGTYSAAVGFPQPILHFYPMIALRGVIALLVIVLTMALWPLTTVLRLAPTSAIRGGGPSDDNAGTWHSRILYRLRHSPLIIYPIRNMLRSARIGAMTILAVALAIGVSISYFMATDSFNSAIEHSFTADEWNVSVDFLVPVWDDELAAYRKLTGIQRLEEVLRGPVRLKAHDVEEPAMITGYQAANTMRRPSMLSGVLPGNNENALALEYKLASSLGVHVGDSVEISNEDRHFVVRVAGIFSGAVPGAAYAPMGAVQQWLNMPNQLSGLLLDLRNPTSNVLNSLRALPHVGAVTPKTQLVAKVKEISSEAVEIIYLAAGFSIAVCVIILIASGSFTVSERREQYTTLRTLGFQDRTVGRLILIEICMLGAVGGLLATPIGYEMASYLIGNLSQAWFKVPTHINWFDVMIPTLPLLLLLPLSALPVMKSIVSVPLAEAIKERRYG